ncbi:hypothetical protein F5Y00DRAFT_260854 [Daldinia vernicosa]|uniref:uncharacterized protein n=1 Tax=Daldinia vernicosa TaxID=114800 RepID=UPI00200764D5|nr:uncharacterized protein F5Y00DRAFT_260854 [Daldinia vernicosa]KAI0850123.1 hypothetical protein F5Y00DRAFT_260854 [Daldinia vernicosa]
MQGVQAAVPRLPIRRSACDRCKGHKLRCLRDPGQERCYRCTRADAQCATTPNVPIRSRRRIGGVSSRTQKRPRQDDRQQNIPPTDVNQAINTPLPIFFEGSSNVQDMTYPPEIMESWDPTIYGSLFGDGFDGNFACFDFTANKAHLPTLDYQPEMMNLSTFQTDALPAGALYLQGQETSIANNTSTSPECVDATQDSVIEVGRGISESETQRLAKINLDLVKLLDQIGRGSPEISLDTLVAPIDQLDDFSGTQIHSVLFSSREFVDVISTLSDANRTPAAITSHGSSPRTPESGPVSNISGSTRGRNSPHSSEYGRTLASPSLVSTIGNRPKRRLDSATLMHILISYIHITQLYLIIFTHCYEALLEISKSDVPSLRELPGLDFGSFPLQSGNLQVTMFIQVIINLFGKMENLLGIPQEFRIGGHGTHHGGLLNEPEFFRVLRAVLSKEELVCKPDLGKGGVNALRKYLEQTRQLLRDSIEP